MRLVDIPRESYGTVIVGGGPAGANFARLANFDEGKVLLIDGAPKNKKRERFPTSLVMPWS